MKKQNIKGLATPFPNTKPKSKTIKVWNNLRYDLRSEFFKIQKLYPFLNQSLSTS